MSSSYLSQVDTSKEITKRSRKIKIKNIFSAFHTKKKIKEKGKGERKKNKNKNKNTKICIT